MTSSEIGWLKFWDMVGFVGFIVVIVGCIIEGVEHFVKFPRQDANKKHRIEKLGWALLILGLAAELIGDKLAKRIADRDNAQLRMQAATLSQRVEELRAKNDALQAQMRPRMLTSRQRDDLAARLRIAPKGPFMIQNDWGDLEARNFADQISAVLTEAGYENRQGTAQTMFMMASGVLMFVENMTNAPPHASAIQSAFLGNGIFMDGKNARQAARMGEVFAGSNSNLAFIWVATKPLISPK